MSHDGPLHYRRGNYRDSCPTPARQNMRASILCTPAINHTVIACGYMLGATSEDGLSHTLRTSDKCADADCESCPTLLCSHTATQLPQVQQMLLDYPSCGYMPVSHGLPVWGEYQQPLQIARQIASLEMCAAATTFYVVIPLC